MACSLECDDNGSVTTLLLYILLPSIFGFLLIYLGSWFFNYFGEQGLSYYKAK